MIHIKICGMTCLEDALAACAAGADYLGFNFYPRSPRYIDPQRCAEITGAVASQYPEVCCVGVFVNAEPVCVQDILAAGHLHLAQLHGDESPELLAALGGRGFKAFRGDPGPTLSAYLAVSPAAPALLLDAQVISSRNNPVYGGTGQAADWSLAQAVARQHPLFLAGGLRPDNVAEAIRQVRPWGVDTASGVETEPGKKDAVKVKAFIEAARSVAGDLNNPR